MAAAPEPQCTEGLFGGPVRAPSLQATPEELMTLNGRATTYWRYRLPSRDAPATVEAHEHG